VLQRYLEREECIAWFTPRDLPAPKKALEVKESAETCPYRTAIGNAIALLKSPAWGSPHQAARVKSRSNETHSSQDDPPAFSGGEQCRLNMVPVATGKVKIFLTYWAECNHRGLTCYGSDEAAMGTLPPSGPGPKGA